MDSEYTYIGYVEDIMKPDYLETIISELRESQYPIFIWGAGSMSEEVNRFLEEAGICVTGRFVNTSKAQSHIVCETKNVYTLEELQEKYEKINVVMGHGHYEKKDVLKDVALVNEVYVIPNPYSQYAGPDAHYVKEHREKIASAMEKLNDEKSKRILERYINFSVTNDINYLLDSEAYIGGMYDFEEMSFSLDEVFVDVGAWEGDSIEGFLKKTEGSYKHIYAFEPDVQSFAKLEENMHGKCNMELYPYGVGKEAGSFCLEGESTQSAFVVPLENTKEKTIIEVKTLDDFFDGQDISVLKIFVPFLFLDILQGGKACIVKNRPKLIINVTADNAFRVFDTILWLAELEVNYKLALRFDFPMPTRLFLYAY